MLTYLMKKVLILLSMIIILSTTASANLIKNDFQIPKTQDFAIIKGKVQSKVSCLPDPLYGATVSVKHINPLYFNKKYSDVTDMDGNFSMEVAPGIYKINVKRDGYRPLLLNSYNILNAEEGKTYDFTFTMIPSRSKNLLSIYSILHFLLRSL
jgi:hypothetical protein